MGHMCEGARTHIFLVQKNNFMQGSFFNLVQNANLDQSGRRPFQQGGTRRGIE